VSPLAKREEALFLGKEKKSEDRKKGRGEKKSLSEREKGPL
jgi:hypothetical protein